MQRDSRFLAQQAAHHWGWHGKAWRQPVSGGPSTWRHWSVGQRQSFWGMAEQQRPLGILLQEQRTQAGFGYKAGEGMGIF